MRRLTFLLCGAGVVLALWLLFGPSQPTLAHPPVPLDPSGVAQCDTCHGPGAKPQPAGEPAAPLLPSDHATYKADSCATCHVAIAGASPTAVSYSECATCHSGTGQVATLKDGDKLNAAVDIPKFLASVHGNFSCTECHETQAKVPHDPLTAEGKRVFTQQMSTQCESCHAGPTKSYEESFHGMAERLGVMRAAACTDCHTAHYVQAPAKWSLADRAAQCATCHAGATESFASGWMGHKEPSVGWFPMVFFAEKGFVALTSIVLGIGIVHVELDGLRWLTNRLRRRKENGE